MQFLAQTARPAVCAGGRTRPFAYWVACAVYAHDWLVKDYVHGASAYTSCLLAHSGTLCADRTRALLPLLLLLVLSEKTESCTLSSRLTLYLAATAVPAARPVRMHARSAVHQLAWLEPRGGGGGGDGAGDRKWWLIWLSDRCGDPPTVSEDAPRIPSVFGHKDGDNQLLEYARRFELR